MRYPLKIIIKKCLPVDCPTSNWFRYRICNKILIDDNSSIKAENQLAWYIYSNWGEGRYMCLAFQKGVEGFWKYWHGDIYANGFLRLKNQDKEVEKLKKEFAQAKTFEEKEMIQEDIGLTKEINETMRSSQRQPCKSIIRYRPGILHAYDEPLPK